VGPGFFVGGWGGAPAPPPHFRLVLMTATPERLEQFTAAGGEIWAAATDGEPIYDIPRPPTLCALALGNEIRGVSPAITMAGSVLLSWMTERRGAGRT
jgi:tRNA G18 (ribose-2'-O)-methylase SpoU